MPLKQVMGAHPRAEASYSKTITSKVFVTLNTSGWAPGYWIWGCLDQVRIFLQNFLLVFLVLAAFFPTCQVLVVRF